ncbi:hypothetical protein JCGZ_24246 [Jatropha curcas]|uniref:Uncharacterized protein n=1 Tax=Jatropha curcas TaxID=180498 RepID=A0A067JMD8_JATCU|nr:hypothetical protein JCGZ_24246 [Jatropha curcas]
MMVDYEVDQGIQIKILRANQTELRRYLHNQSDGVLEIVTDLTGANKADQTELWIRVTQPPVASPNRQSRHPTASRVTQPPVASPNCQSRHPTASRVTQLPVASRSYKNELRHAAVS